MELEALEPLPPHFEKVLRILARHAVQMIKIELENKHSPLLKKAQKYQSNSVSRKLK